jgi:hypothetical protein
VVDDGLEGLGDGKSHERYLPATRLRELSDLRELSLVERKKILRTVIPRKSSCIEYVSYLDWEAVKLFELIKKQDLEGLVVNEKTGNTRSRRFGAKS